MTIDFDSPEWRVRVMQDKADVLGFQVRLLWSATGGDPPRTPSIQFVPKAGVLPGRDPTSRRYALFELNEAETRLEQWLAFYNESGRKPPE